MASAVLLNQAKRKMILLRNNGVAGWKIKQFVVGDATSYTPTEDQTGLRNEILRKDIESSTVINENVIQYMCRVDEDECAGHAITEFGLVDIDGMVLCVRTFPAKQKENDQEMLFKINDTF